MKRLRPLLAAALPLALTLAAHADPPPVFFPQAPIVTQPAAPPPQAPTLQAPQQAVAMPAAAPQPAAQPVVRPAPPPPAPAPVLVAQPQMVQVQAAQAQPQPQAVVYAPVDPGAPQAAPPAPGEPQRAWLAPASPPPVANADAGPSPWRALAVLLAVAAIGGGALYLQRVKGGGAMGGLLGSKGQGGLRVVDSVRVGPRAQLVVAEFGGRRFLVGVNDTSIRRVAYLGRSGAAPQGARAPAQEEAPIDVPAPGGFTEAMRRALASSASQPVSPVASSQPQHPVATTPSVPSVNAADLLASETRDVVDLGAGARMSRVLASRDAGNSPRPSDVYTRTPGPSNVEEQVAGLTRRRIPRRG